MLRRICSSNVYKLSHIVMRPPIRQIECYVRAAELDGPNRVLKDLCEEGDLLTARKRFDSMSIRDTKSYNIMIHSYARRQEFEQAELLLYDMNMNGLTPDIVTFTSLISCYFQANRCEQGEKLMTQMNAFQLEPNQVTIGAAITGYVNCGMLVRARLLLEETEKRLGFDEATYNAMIVYVPLYSC